MKKVQSKLYKISTTLFIVLLLFLILWKTSPVEYKNFILSNICDDFYEPVFEGNFKIWKTGPKDTITFKPKYFGDYEFCIVVDGTMKDIAYPEKEIPGVIRALITLDGQPIRNQKQYSWQGFIQHQQGKTAYEIFNFHVKQGTRKVSIHLEVIKPFSYFKTRKNSHVIIRNNYTL